MSNYAKNDMDAAKAAREAMDRSGVRWWKAEVDANYVRIAPPHVNMIDPTSGAHRFYHPVCLHFGVGPAKKVVPCPRRMLDKFCPICDAAFALKNSGQERAGNDLLPSWQAYMNIIVYGEVRNKEGKIVGLEPIKNKQGEIEVRVWSASRGVLDQIFEAVEEREAEVGQLIDIADPENGYILKITRKGTDKENTKYRVILDREPTSIMDIADVWDDQLVDTTSISPTVEPGTLKALLEGGGDDPFDKPKAIEAPTVRTVVADRFADDEDVVEGEVREIAEDEVPPVNAAKKLKDLIDGKEKKRG